MGEKPENKITLTAEQISAAQEQIKKLLIFGQKVDADPETIAQEIGENLSKKNLH